MEILKKRIEDLEECIAELEKKSAFLETEVKRLSEPFMWDGSEFAEALRANY